MKLSPGWTRESADLYVHESGARLSKTTYRGKMAWWFFPVSLDIQAVEYPPTDAGCEEAFATSGQNLPKAKVKRTPAPSKASVAEAAAPSDKSEDEDEDEDKEEDGEKESD